MDIAVTGSIKRGRGVARLLLIGFALIAVGGLLELAVVPLANVLGRLDDHHAHVMRLAQAAGDSRNAAQVAALTANSIDESWLHYDLVVQQLELTFDQNALTPNAPAVRNAIVAQLAAMRPMRALTDVAPPTAQDPAFIKARTAFAGVLATYHDQLGALAVLLDPRSHEPGNVLAAATQDVRELNVSVDRRWAAMSIAAKAVSNDAARSADAAQDRLATEQSKSLVAELIAP